MRTATLSTLGLALAAGASHAQQATQSPCDGDVTVVRVSEIKPGGTMNGLLAAAAAHEKWYRDRGVADNEIVVSRVMVRDTVSKTVKYSDSQALTYHIRPPGAGRVTPGDEAWNAYVKQYQQHSEIKAEYVTCMPAPDRRADEAAIRALVAKMQTEPRAARRTDDAVFVSGLYPRPILFSEGKPVGDVQPLAEARSEQRRNVQSRDEIVRLEVAAAGDMAYEFGNSTLAFDMADTKEHRSFNTSYLRVWRKVAGEWRIAAHFVRPNRD